MSIFKVVILSLALLLAVEAVGPFRSHDDADTRKFGEERVHPPDSAAKSATVLVNRFKLWFWRLTGEVPENLFSKLKLDQATAGLLTNPKFSIWTEFVKATKTNYEASMIGVLMKKLPGTILSEVIAAGMKNPKTEKIAMMLQEQRFHVLKEENFQPAVAFTNVGMSVKENFFSHPAFERWLQYTSEFNSDKSTRMDNLCKAIGTKPVIERLDEGMRIGSTKEKATNLYNELLENFVEKEYAPAQFLDVVDIDKRSFPTVDEIFDTPVYKMWPMYTKRYITKLSATGSLETIPSEHQLLVDALNKIYGKEALRTG